MNFFKELKRRNPILFYLSMANLVAFIICLLLIKIDSQKIVLGINAWIKPAKFYISIAIFSATMGWFLEYLKMPRKVKKYSWMAVIVMLIETIIITWQAANGRMSHFNISTPLYGALFNVMGAAITVLTVWTGYISYLFFKKKDFDISIAYLWGIRLGLIMFVIFAFEGGVMAAMLRHTVGAKDGQIGFPFINWSKNFGDLRVAHFFGIHALQILPLAGNFLARKKGEIIFFSTLYFIMVCVFLIQALRGVPIF